MLVDTHCHLNFERFDTDRAAVIERARQSGVQYILNPGIDLATSRQAIQLADAYHEVYAAVGVHPNDALDWDADTLSELRRMVQHPKVLAIGEIGLDYYWKRSPHDLQRSILRQQLEVAAESGLPVVIHARNASPDDRSCTQDVIDILADWHKDLCAGSSPLSGRPGVLHSFSDNLSVAQQAFEMDFCIGITGPVTFRKADEMQDVATHLPLDALLIETDAPFLSPHPHRGERNEPAYVQYVANKIAGLRGLEVSKVAQITTANAERLFLWRVIR